MTPDRVLFKDLALIEPLQEAVPLAGYTTPTPIQAAYDASGKPDAVTSSPLQNATDAAVGWLLNP